MKKKTDVNDILNEFLADFESSGEEALARYVKEHPELTEKIYRRAGIARMFSRLPEAELTPDEEQSLNLRASSVVQNLIFEMKNQPAEEAAEAGETESTPFSSLLDRLKEMEETFESAAAKLRLSGLILIKLDKRRVSPKSVPRFLYEKIAEILRVKLEVIYSYACLPPLLPRGTHYKSASSPTLETQPEFSQLVNWDPDMSADDKAYWLSFPPIDGIDQITNLAEETK